MSKLAENHGLRTTGRCFLCKMEGNDYKCGREMAHAETLTSRVAPLRFKWAKSSWAGDCEKATKCEPLDILDKIASRAIAEMPQQSSATFAHGARFWVCGESLWSERGLSSTASGPLPEHSAGKEGGPSCKNVKGGVITGKGKQDHCAYQCQVSGTVNLGKTDWLEYDKTPEGPVARNARGLHFGGVVCAVNGFNVKCRRFQTGASALGIRLDSFRKERCPAWHGGYWLSSDITSSKSADQNKGWQGWHMVAARHDSALDLMSSNHAISHCAPLSLDESMMDMKMNPTK